MGAIFLHEKKKEKGKRKLQPREISKSKRSRGVTLLSSKKKRGTRPLVTGGNR